MGRKGPFCILGALLCVVCFRPSFASKHNESQTSRKSSSEVSRTDADKRRILVQLIQLFQDRASSSPTKRREAIEKLEALRGSKGQSPTHLKEALDYYSNKLSDQEAIRLLGSLPVTTFEGLTKVLLIEDYPVITEKIDKAITLLSPPKHLDANSLYEAFGLLNNLSDRQNKLAKVIVHFMRKDPPQEVNGESWKQGRQFLWNELQNPSALRNIRSQSQFIKLFTDSKALIKYFSPRSKSHFNPGDVLTKEELAKLESQLQKVWPKPPAKKTVARQDPPKVSHTPKPERPRIKIPMRPKKEYILPKFKDFDKSAIYDLVAKLDEEIKALEKDRKKASDRLYSDRNKIYQRFYTYKDRTYKDYLRDHGKIRATFLAQIRAREELKAALLSALNKNDASQFNAALDQWKKAASNVEDVRKHLLSQLSRDREWLKSKCDYHEKRDEISRSEGTEKAQLSQLFQALLSKANGVSATLEKTKIAGSEKEAERLKWEEQLSVRARELGMKSKETLDFDALRKKHPDIFEKLDKNQKTIWNTTGWFRGKGSPFILKNVLGSLGQKHPLTFPQIIEVNRWLDELEYQAKVKKVKKQAEEEAAKRPPPQRKPPKIEPPSQQKVDVLAHLKQTPADLDLPALFKKMDLPAALKEKLNKAYQNKVGAHDFDKPYLTVQDLLKDLIADPRVGNPYQAYQVLRKLSPQERKATEALVKLHKALPPPHLHGKALKKWQDSLKRIEYELKTPTIPSGLAMRALTGDKEAVKAFLNDIHQTKDPDELQKKLHQVPLELWAALRRSVRNSTHDSKVINAAFQRYQPFDSGHEDPNRPEKAKTTDPAQRFRWLRLASDQTPAGSTGDLDPRCFSDRKNRATKAINGLVYLASQDQLKLRTESHPPHHPWLFPKEHREFLATAEINRAMEELKASYEGGYYFEHPYRYELSLIQYRSYLKREHKALRAALKEPLDEAHLKRINVEPAYCSTWVSRVKDYLDTVDEALKRPHPNALLSANEYQKNKFSPGEYFSELDKYDDKLRKEGKKSIRSPDYYLNRHVFEGKGIGPFNGTDISNEVKARISYLKSPEAIRLMSRALAHGNTVRQSELAALQAADKHFERLKDDMEYRERVFRLRWLGKNAQTSEKLAKEALEKKYDKLIPSRVQFGFSKDFRRQIHISPTLPYPFYKPKEILAEARLFLNEAKYALSTGKRKPYLDIDQKRLKNWITNPQDKDFQEQRKALHAYHDYWDKLLHSKKNHRLYQVYKGWQEGATKEEKALGAYLKKASVDYSKAQVDAIMNKLHGSIPTDKIEKAKLLARVWEMAPWLFTQEYQEQAKKELGKIDDKTYAALRVRGTGGNVLEMSSNDRDSDFTMRPYYDWEGNLRVGIVPGERLSGRFASYAMSMKALKDYAGFVSTSSKNVWSDQPREEAIRKKAGELYQKLSKTPIPKITDLDFHKPEALMAWYLNFKAAGKGLRQKHPNLEAAKHGLDVFIASQIINLEASSEDATKLTSMVGDVDFAMDLISVITFGAGLVAKMPLKVALSQGAKVLARKGIQLAIERSAASMENDLEEEAVKRLLPALAISGKGGARVVLRRIAGHAIQQTMDMVKGKVQAKLEDELREKLVGLALREVDTKGMFVTDGLGKAKNVNETLALLLERAGHKPKGDPRAFAKLMEEAQKKLNGSLASLGSNLSWLTDKGITMLGQAEKKLVNEAEKAASKMQAYLKEKERLKKEKAIQIASLKEALKKKQKSLAEKIHSFKPKGDGSYATLAGDVEALQKSVLELQSKLKLKGEKPAESKVPPHLTTKLRDLSHLGQQKAKVAQQRATWREKVSQLDREIAEAKRAATGGCKCGHSLIWEGRYGTYWCQLKLNGSVLEKYEVGNPDANSCNSYCERWIQEEPRCRQSSSASKDVKALEQSHREASMKLASLQREASELDGKIKRAKLDTHKALGIGATSPEDKPTKKVETKELEKNKPVIRKPAKVEKKPKVKPPAEANMIVYLSDSSAKIYIDGTLTSSSGLARKFTSPKLKHGRKYFYNIEVRWTQWDPYYGGYVEKVRKRKVEVFPGKTSRVDIN